MIEQLSFSLHFLWLAVRQEVVLCHPEGKGGQLQDKISSSLIWRESGTGFAWNHSKRGASERLHQRWECRGFWLFGIHSFQRPLIRNLSTSKSVCRKCHHLFLRLSLNTVCSFHPFKYFFFFAKGRKCF